jgi:chemotaxis family two-component system response regulator Rcp1
MNYLAPTKYVNILLVEDNPADVRLTQEAFKGARIKNTLDIAMDGEEALNYIKKLGKHENAETPDLILLDLNIPKKNGHAVLAEIKTDAAFSHIPIIILTTSSAEEDILSAYKRHANCYITKPGDFRDFIKVVRTIEDFWFKIARLPKARSNC